MKIPGTVSDRVLAILIAALIVMTFVLLHILFSRPISGLATEFLAAAVAVALVVVSVGVTIHFQNKAETERQFRVCLFEHKMKEYCKFLELTASADDDERVTDDEVERIRNQARVLAMLAQKPLLICLADFVTNLEQHRELHGGGSANGTYQQVIASMREDLEVVDTVADESVRAIHRLVLKEPRRGRAPQRTRAHVSQPPHGSAPPPRPAPRGKRETPERGL